MQIYIIFIHYFCQIYSIIMAQEGFNQLDRTFGTLLGFFLQLHPILQNLFELFKDETVGEPLSAGVVFDEIVFMGGSFFDGSVN